MARDAIMPRRPWWTDREKTRLEKSHFLFYIYLVGPEYIGQVNTDKAALSCRLAGGGTIFPALQRALLCAAQPSCGAAGPADARLGAVGYRDLQ